MRFNINDCVAFEPTEAGRGVMLDAICYPRRLEDGRWEMQAWDFMRVFGPHFYLGGPTLIHGCTIELKPTIPA